MSVRPRQVCEAHGEFDNGLQVFSSRLRSGRAGTEFKRGLVPHGAAPETHLPQLIILAAIWQQIAPFWPAFADSAGRKSFKNQWPAATLLPWHGRGRRFEPDQVHQVLDNSKGSRA
jgi:hypothetical protein